MNAHADAPKKRALFLVTIFLQMLPATLLVPAIRPLFASFYQGSESSMHAFMSLNMLGACLLVPLVGRAIDRGVDPRRLYLSLALTDAALLAAMSIQQGSSTVLVLRFAEGACHVGAATVLIASYSRTLSSERSSKAMGAAGSAIILAVVLGSAIGGFLLEWDLRTPLLAGAGLSVFAALIGSRLLPSLFGRRREKGARSTLAMLKSSPRLRAPVTIAFAARFTIGCVVVTFALLAHHKHGISDGAVGLLFACMTFPFALATYPAAYLAERISMAASLGVATLLYAGCLIALPLAPLAALPVLMLLSGLCSAMIFAAILSYAAELSEPEDRGKCMALVNIAGSMGMLLGPMVAGIGIAIAKSFLPPEAAYSVAFFMAAGALVAWLLRHASWLAQTSGKERKGIRQRRAALSVALAEAGK